MFRIDKMKGDHNMQLQQILARGEVDFINSVCPCAGLSMLNTSVKGPSGRGSDAQQNQWMLRSAEFVFQNIRPKVLWGENAPGLFLALGEEMIPKLRGLGAQYGYSFSMVKTNTLLHGLPQQRMRTFYFFWRSTYVPMLNYTHREAPHLHEYLKTIPKFATFQDTPVVEGSITDRFKPYQYALMKEQLNHEEFVKKYVGGGGACTTLSKYLEKNNLIDECIEWLKEHYPNAKWSLNATGKSRTFIDFLEHMKNKLSKGMGYWDDSPKFMGSHFTAVITKNVSFAAHPSEDRFFNIRELLHLMGMPHDFQIENPAKNWNHICQNVPVNTATDWAAEVVKFCRGELEMTPFIYMKQDNNSQRVVHKEMGEVKLEIKEEPDLDDEIKDVLKHAEKMAEDMMKNEAVKMEDDMVKEEDKKPVVVKVEKRSFSSDFHNFVTAYKPDEALTSPPKKIKIENEEYVKEKQDDNTSKLKAFFENFKPEDGLYEHVKVEPVKPKYYKCGICMKVEFQEKTLTEDHMRSCAEMKVSIKSDPNTAYQCGSCKTRMRTKEMMFDHWIMDCVHEFNRNMKLSNVFVSA